MKLAVLLSLFTALAVAAWADEADFTPALIEPSAGQQLQAGSTSVVAWSATSVPRDVEEWEAFASVDGGRTYTMRLTPHLDRSIRRFAWRVPNLPGARVTITLRFGDEHHERAFVFARQARITGLESLLNVLLRPAPIASPTPGESAEGDEDRVIEWVDGARDGSGLREYSAAAGDEVDPSSCCVTRGDEPLAAVATSEDDGSVVRCVLILDVLPPRPQSRVAHAEPPAPDVLLGSTRLNI